jgi:hypothetical protein
MYKNNFKGNRMKSIIKLVVVSIVVLISACASSDNKSAGAAPENNDAKICKMEKKTGSNVRKKVCRTAEEIEKMRRTAKELAQRDVFKTTGNN